MRISDWSSDVCSSDLRPDFSAPSAARYSSAIKAAKRSDAASTMRKFSPRLAEHFEAAPDRKTRHDAGDKQVRPCLLGAEYAQRRTENCNVTDGIVARTDPHRAHVRIAFAIAEQQQRDKSEEHTSELQSLMR